MKMPLETTYDMVKERIKVYAHRNRWLCFEEGRFTWFYCSCPKMGTSECPASMVQDRPCGGISIDLYEV